MPRDLESIKATLDGMPPLSKENHAASPPPDDDPLPLYRIPAALIEDRFKKMKDIHPYSLLLSQDDLDDCDWLEHVAFDSIEAASREKIAYRLHTSAPLCSGLFTSGHTTSPSPLGPLIRSRSFPSVDSSDSDRKKVLLAHVIATKHSSPLIIDPTMSYPPDWRTKYQLSPSDGSGHDEDGQTVCLHSLCVHPDFQGMGLGRVLLLSWVQRVKEAGVARRIALICREKFVPFYETAGFKRLGESKCQYGGGGWVDMVVEFGEGKYDDDEDF